MKKNILLVIALMLFATVGAFAQVPTDFSIQGYAEDAASEPYDGSINVTFEIWDAATAGNSVYSQTESALPVTKGYFEFRTNGIIASQIAAVQGQLWYQFTIEGVTQKRVPFSAVPHSITSGWSKEAERALQADPTGPAGGDLTGEYPNPTLNTDRVYTILDNYINVNGISATPKGPVGGDIGGNYPNELLIKDRAVRSNHIATNAVKGEHIAASAISGDKIIDGSIAADDIALGSIYATHMAGIESNGQYAFYAWNGSAWQSRYLTDAVQSGTITTVKLADGAVTATKLADEAVQLNHLAIPDPADEDQIILWDAATTAWIYKNLSEISTGGATLTLDTFAVPFQAEDGTVTNSFIKNYNNKTSADNPWWDGVEGNNVVQIDDSVALNTQYLLVGDRNKDGATAQIFGNLELDANTEFTTPAAPTFTISGISTTSKATVILDDADLNVNGIAKYNSTTAGGQNGTPYTDLATASDLDPRFASVGYVKETTGNATVNLATKTYVDSVKTYVDSVKTYVDSVKIESSATLNAIPFISRNNTGDVRISDSPIRVVPPLNTLALSQSAAYTGGSTSDNYMPFASIADSMLATVAYVKKNGVDLSTYNEGDILNVFVDESATSATKSFKQSNIWSSKDSVIDVRELNDLFPTAENSLYPSITLASTDALVTSIYEMNTKISGNVLFTNATDSPDSINSVYMPNHVLLVGASEDMQSQVFGTFTSGTPATLSVFTHKDAFLSSSEHSVGIKINPYKERGTTTNPTKLASTNRTTIGVIADFTDNDAYSVRGGIGGLFAVHSSDTTGWDNDESEAQYTAGFITINTEYFLARTAFMSVPNPALSVVGTANFIGAMVPAPTTLDEISDPESALQTEWPHDATNSKIQYGTTFIVTDATELGHGWNGQIIYVVNTSNSTVTISTTGDATKTFSLAASTASSFIFIESADADDDKGYWYPVTSPTVNAAP